MAPLKENLRYHLKKHHSGEANTVTIHDLARELLPIRVNTTEIREAVKELCLEGIPIVMDPKPPRSIYFARSEEEVREWKEAILNVCENIYRRKRQIEWFLELKKDPSVRSKQYPS